jgi:hypothetical protein
VTQASARGWAGPAIRVGLRTEDGRTQYRIGETATLLIDTDTAGYLSVFALSTGDLATLVWPVPGASSAVAPDQVIRLTVPATDPPGRDVIAAVVTPQPITLLAPGRLSQEDVHTAIGLPEMRKAVADLRSGKAGPASPIAASPRGYALLLLETVRPRPGS